MTDDPSVLGAVLSGLTAAIVWPLVLRGPYWLYRRYKGRPVSVWWPWGVLIAALTGGTVFLLLLGGY